MIDQIARLSLAGVAMMMAKKFADHQAAKPQSLPKHYRELARAERAVRKYGTI